MCSVRVPVCLPACMRGILCVSMQMPLFVPGSHYVCNDGWLAVCVHGYVGALLLPAFPYVCIGVCVYACMYGMHACLSPCLPACVLGV